MKGIDVLYDLGLDHASLAVFRSNDRHLANAAASGMEFLRFVLVLFQSADIRLVNFCGVGERCGFAEKLPDTGDKEPCAFLRHAQLAVNLHA